jgi:DNA polymerase I-like protein with 3'-5' exonuclease and polymerase domains
MKLERAFTYRAMNRLMQGSGARQTKRAMVACYREGIPLLIQMHDELGASVASEAVGERIAELMRTVVKLVVPVRVDLEFGRTWGSAKHTWENRDR